MTERLFICTDLDRTLIPNGPQSESPHARQHFAILADRPEVTLAYVSGRHRELVEQAISRYRLPLPDFVVGDVGTTIYHVGPQQDWHHLAAWETEIAQDWGGHSHADLKAMLVDLATLRLQEASRQNTCKLSYYLPLHSNIDDLEAKIQQRLMSHGVRSRLIWSVDEPTGVGLLDVLPARASKYHAIEALMQIQNFNYANTVFCGDSGNDLEVLASPIPAVLVANSQQEVQTLARKMSEENGCSEQLYIARGGFMGMNGNYSAGMLEGIACYHPSSVDWMNFAARQHLG